MGITRVRNVLAAHVLATAIVLLTAGAASGSSGTIAGSIFKDLNRDGVMQAGEAAISDIQLYLYDSAGNYLATTLSDASGHYTFGGLADGDYTVDFEYASWQSLRADWVPTTTGTLYPERAVHLVGSVAADFGWRPIMRSTTLGSPITTFTGPDRTRVEVYDDVLAASDLYNTLTLLTFRGAEAPFVTVRFDLGAGDTTVTTAPQDSSGRYTSYSASIYLDYENWLTYGDANLDHEYGHAWSLYNAYMTQQDPSFAGYLKARGLTNDPRLDTSHAWNRREMIAEDYRQFFGSANARTVPQENNAIPPASQVSGLKDYLQTTFVTASGGATQPTTPLTIARLSMSPAPVKTSGTATFDISTPASLTVRIIDGAGTIVRTLLSSASEAAGAVSVTWNRTNSSGRKVARGTYTVRVDASGGGQSASASLVFTVS